jgi:hypothetical protein
MSQPTQRQLDAFRRFSEELPHGNDIELVLLKGHILIEEQVRLLIDRRVRNPEALRESSCQLDCAQAMQLARAFFPPDYQSWLWKALAKLNKMRNDIAHKILSRQSLADRIAAWVDSVPSGADGFTDKKLQFEYTMWQVFDAMSELVDGPSVT